MAHIERPPFRAGAFPDWDIFTLRPIGPDIEKIDEFVRNYKAVREARGTLTATLSGDEIDINGAFLALAIPCPLQVVSRQGCSGVLRRTWRRSRSRLWIGSIGRTPSWLKERAKGTKLKFVNVLEFSLDCRLNRLSLFGDLVLRMEVPLP